MLAEADYRHARGLSFARNYHSFRFYKPLAIGAVLRNPAYAATLRRLANEGASAFYTGAIAQDIVDTVRAHPTNPGDLTLTETLRSIALFSDEVMPALRAKAIAAGQPAMAG